MSGTGSGARTHGNLNDTEVNDAAWAAGRGAVVGAAKWGVFSAIFGLAAFQFSPLYRGLTFQFKCFIHMSFMTFGSIIEADSRLRIHGAWQRQHKKSLRDAEVWRRYQEEYDASMRTSSTEQGEASSGKKE